MGAREVALRAERGQGTEAGKELPKLRCCNRTADWGSVPPAYGDFSLALVMHSNEGGQGSRHNMKEDPGSSTLIMKREHGQEVPCDPGQVIRILGCTSPPLPPIRATRTEPPPTPFRYILLPLPKSQLRPASEKNTSASGLRSEAMDWARGGCGGHFELFNTSLGGQTAELVTSAG
jgi:hypothetical protein